MRTHIHHGVRPTITCLFNDQLCTRDFSRPSRSGGTNKCQEKETTSSFFFYSLAAQRIKFSGAAEGGVRCNALLDAKTGNILPMKKRIVSSSPDVMGGTLVFEGTRVPVQTFIEYIEGGHSIDDFLDGFPSVKRTQLIEFLEEAQKRMNRKAA